MQEVVGRHPILLREFLLELAEYQVQEPVARKRASPTRQGGWIHHVASRKLHLTMRVQERTEYLPKACSILKQARRVQERARRQRRQAKERAEHQRMDVLASEARRLERREAAISVRAGRKAWRAKMDLQKGSRASAPLSRSVPPRELQCLFEAGRKGVPPL